MSSELEHMIHGVRVVGIDLSGPSNTKETALLWGHAQGAAFHYTGHRIGAGDADILEVVRQQAAMGPVCVGLDAPLSYQPGGGMRAGDSSLQTELIAAGMHPGSVMAPTMNRMCYLTLRGIAVAQMLIALDVKNPVGVVEVHPGGSMALSGAPVHLIKAMKDEPTARSNLRSWLGDQNMMQLPMDVMKSDHLLAAAAAALATWRWKDGRSNWLRAAEPPHHPFDFTC
jgi:uncharacterized protein